MPVKILHDPAPALRQRCAPYRFADDGGWSDAQLGRQLMLMLDAMYFNGGIGIAAPQIGWSARVVAVDPVGERHQARILFNPQVWWWSEEVNVDVEGCLSVPGAAGLVERHNRVKVAYFNRHGLRQELDTEDDTLLARVIQHEVDHLQGILFTDKLTK